MRKTLLAWLAVTWIVLYLGGCNGTSDEAASSEPQQVKAAAEYEAEAEQEITEQNMDAELDRLERAIDEEAAELD